MRGGIDLVPRPTYAAADGWGRGLASPIHYLYVHTRAVDKGGAGGWGGGGGGGGGGGVVIKSQTNTD